MCGVRGSRIVCNVVKVMILRRLRQTRSLCLLSIDTTILISSILCSNPGCTEMPVHVALSGISQTDSAVANQVLVHAGTGGVGLAAINIAKALNCSIFATAGTPQKRALLKSLGVQAAASSRDTTFTDITGYRAGVASCCSGARTYQSLSSRQAIKRLKVKDRQGWCNVAYFLCLQH